MAGGLQGCRGHPQPDGHQQEGPAAQDDGPVLSEAGPGVLEVWQPAVSCCCGKLKLGYLYKVYIKSIVIFSQVHRK